MQGIDFHFRHCEEPQRGDVAISCFDLSNMHAKNEHRTGRFPRQGFAGIIVRLPLAIDLF